MKQIYACTVRNDDSDATIEDRGLERILLLVSSNYIFCSRGRNCDEHCNLQVIFM